MDSDADKSAWIADRFFGFPNLHNSKFKYNFKFNNLLNNIKQDAIIIQ